MYKSDANGLMQFLYRNKKKQTDNINIHYNINILVSVISAGTTTVV